MTVTQMPLFDISRLTTLYFAEGPPVGGSGGKKKPKKAKKAKKAKKKAAKPK
jgi:hypothetical protein